jgi:hypothetical protein
MHPHAFDRGVHLLVIANIGSDAQSGTTGMFDFEMTQIELGFAARQESYSRALSGESDSEAFPDPASRTGYQHRHSL